MHKTKAIQFIQNGRIFYSVVIPAGKLAELSKVDVWDPNNPQSGYQRSPSTSRKREIGQYALKPDSIMPVGGLLNARDVEDADGGHYGSKLKFEIEYKEGDISFGTLTIPDKALPLYIVDMQHRIGGYEWAIQQQGGERLENFPLVATIADGLTKMEEVDQFDIINTTQKKVRTDLARRLKSIQVKDVDHMLALDKRGKLWEAKGPVIAENLNTSSGVWSGKILPPNKSKADQPTMVVRETSFVTSLKPILQTPYFIRQSEETAAELINRYWTAIQKVWPDAFKNPDAYVIQKSPGVFSLHELAPEVFEMARDKGEITVKSIFEIVKSLGEIGEAEYWEVKNSEGAASYGSMQGFRFLASELRQYLPKIEN
ncbi:MAG: DGQHR domain-containing protein [Anaerolineales bacterium]|nr:DGQHR domain-containing protein [Anaerolineales bacterium]